MERDFPKLQSRHSLLIALLFFTVASVYRAFHFWITGFFVPDEYGYALYTWAGTIFYQGRDFFMAANIVFFQLFRITFVDRLVALMPLYFMTWSSIGMFSVYRVCKMLKFGDKPTAAAILLSLTIPVFALFSASFLTEPVGFAMCMLGIFFTMKFATSGSWTWKLSYGPLAALSFAAAAYVRFDFTIYQLAGFVPFLYVELRRVGRSLGPNRETVKSLISFLLFIVPSTIFLYFPQRTGEGAVAAVGGVTNVVTTTFVTTVSTFLTTVQVIRNNITTIITSLTTTTTTIAVSAQGPSFATLPQLLVKTFYLFFVGLSVGYSPAMVVVLAIPFFLLLYGVLRSRGRESFLGFWIALLAVGSFVGTAWVFSTVGYYIPLSTVLRYSYDMVPAYFILAPVLFARFRGKKGYALIVIGLVIYGGVVANTYQGFLQSNLGYAYPFPSGHDSLLTPDYRTPYADLRDYFLTLPPSQTVTLLGEAQTTYGNRNSLPQDWNFTPGVAAIKNLLIYPYLNSTAFLKLHPGSFYLYVEKGGDKYFNAASDYLLEMRNGTYSAASTGLPFTVTDVQVIYNQQSFYLAKVTLAYNQ